MLAHSRGPKGEGGLIAVVRAASGSLWSEALVLGRATTNIHVHLYHCTIEPCRLLQQACRFDTVSDVLHVKLSSKLSIRCCIATGLALTALPTSRSCAFLSE
jgi:hypothetical protein